MMDDGCEREGEWNRIIGNTLSNSPPPMKQERCVKVNVLKYDIIGVFVFVFVFVEGRRKMRRLLSLWILILPLVLQ
jgi:hypothetical protein